MSSDDAAGKDGVPAAEEAAPAAAAAAADSDSGGFGKTDDDEEYRLVTAPFDPRFPNTNQAKHCFVSFLDYHRCIKLRGEDYAPCQYFLKVYKTICPNAWIAKWEDQMEAGKFPAKI